MFFLFNNVLFLLLKRIFIKKKFLIVLIKTNFVSPNIFTRHFTKRLAIKFVLIN